MMNITQGNFITDRPGRNNAMATATLLHHAAAQTRKLGLQECSLVLYSIVDAIRTKFHIPENETVPNIQLQLLFNNAVKNHSQSDNHRQN